MVRTAEATMDPASAGCADWDDHQFAEEYYGYRCTRCNLFFAYGHAPWEDMSEFMESCGESDDA